MTNILSAIFLITQNIKIQGNLKVIVRNSMLVYAKIKYFAFLVIIVDTAKIVTKLWKSVRMTILIVMGL